MTVDQSSLLLLLSILVVVVRGTSYNNHFAVEIKGGPEEVERIAKELDCKNEGRIFDNIYQFSHQRIRKRSTETHQEAFKTFSNHKDVSWFEQQKVISRPKRQGRLPYEGRGLSMPPPPIFDDFDDRAKLNDKRWNQMWYLNRGRKLDMNVQEAWDNGYTGKGVYVTILDDGVERFHPDLKRNYDPGSSFDVNDGDDDPTPRYDLINSNRHGTRCAGEVAATANNTNCAVGVAYDAGIGGLRMLDGDVTDAVEARSLLFNNNHIHIYSASWGPDDDGATVDGPGHLAVRAFLKGIAEGRNGKGSIFVWASGNGGKFHDNCNCDGYTNSIWTLSVSSATENGLIPWYSESCSSSLVSTYSSGSSGERKVITTDLHRACTSTHTGTSASAPMAAGIIALALEANQNLTWRDVQHISVRCAHKANLRAPDWSRNGVGRNFSHAFGYGIMDAGCMVNVAKTWTEVPKQIHAIVSGDRRVDKMIPGRSSATSIMNVTEAEGIAYLEHIQARVTLSASRRGDISIYLTSPAGTRSRLLDKRAKDFARTGFNDWPFLTVHMWEESPIGEWTLEISNGGQSIAELKEWSLSFLGTVGHPQPSESSKNPPPSFKNPDHEGEIADVSPSKDASDNCTMRNPQMTGWCLECESSLILYNGRCVEDCPEEGVYEGMSDRKLTCLPCHYSCRTCSGSNDYECSSCYGDAKFLNDSSEERYCVAKTAIDRISSSSRWYYVLTVGFAVNLMFVIILIVYIVRRSKRFSRKYSDNILSKNQLRTVKSISAVPFRDYKSSSEDDEA